MGRIRLRTFAETRKVFRGAEAAEKGRARSASTTQPSIDLTPPRGHLSHQLRGINLSQPLLDLRKHVPDELSGTRQILEPLRHSRMR